jgi:C4-dicarboxylate-specific signal transduction histidine kinase
MMTGRPTLFAALAVAAATVLFWFVIHQISGLWLGVALRPELSEALEQHRTDQLTLRKLDRARTEEYRRRFEKAQSLLEKIEILRLGQREMLQRFEVLLVATFALASSAAAFALLLRHRRAVAKERIAFAGRIAALQESARWQAHEIKGPLTAARLELERCGDLLASDGSPADIAAAHQSIADELERLARTTRGFTSFAGLGKPVLLKESLSGILQEFVTTFTGAWGAMALIPDGRDAAVCADRDMCRQVLVNLCSNSAAAGATSVRLTIEPGARPAVTIQDDGSGIAPTLGEKIFDPYVTTRRTPEGLGLGLAISRKIMLDHGGDLKLVRGNDGGATFAILFGESASCPEEARDSPAPSQRWN